MIPLYKSYIPPDALDPLAAVFAGGQVAEGEHVRAFESALASYIGNTNVVSAGDVSAGIALGLLLAGVKPGDEVVASPMACLATNEPILNVHGRVRWCDVDAHTGMPGPAELERAITDKTRAVLIPLWAGDVPELDELIRAARTRGAAVVLDAGEALGSEYQGKRIGSTGEDIAVFSFHAIRHITTGEGAAMAFKDPALAARARILKRYGINRATFRDALGEISPSSDIPEAGFNSYMTNVAGAIGVVQMKRLPGVVARHVENGAFYDQALRGIPGISLCRRAPASRSSSWVYTLMADRRDDLLKALRDRGVYASKVHLRNDLYSCFGKRSDPLPGLDAFSSRYLCIPSGWWVSDEDRGHVVSSIRRGW